MRLALVLSPLMAIYWVMPVYIFAHLEWRLLAQAALFLSIMIYIFWLINIFLLEQVQNALWRFLLSYLFMVVLHSSVSWVTVLAPGSHKISLGLYPLLALLALDTFIFILIQSNVLQFQKEQAELEVQSLKLSNLEVQKQVLMQQLQPHFLFNSLSTLKSLIRENALEAEDYVLKLSEFLRYSVQHQSADWLSLREELQFTQDYLDLQKMRFGKALQCSIAIPEEALNLHLPMYALQTLVENAIKHNAFTTSKPLFIQIEYMNARLKVSNNKAPKTLQVVSGTGLQNLRKRYELKTDKGIEVHDQELEFVVYLDLISNSK